MSLLSNTHVGQSSKVGFNLFVEKWLKEKTIDRHFRERESQMKGYREFVFDYRHEDQHITDDLEKIIKERFPDLQTWGSSEAITINGLILFGRRVYILYDQADLWGFQSEERNNRDAVIFRTFCQGGQTHVFIQD